MLFIYNLIKVFIYALQKTKDAKHHETVVEFDWPTMRDACMTSALLFMQHMYQMICENENVQQTRTIKDVHKMFTCTRERMHEVCVRVVC
jgi:hypothetical protein